MKKIIKFTKKITVSFIGIVGLLALSITACDPTIESLSYDLPEANSKTDLTPPSASFSASVTSDYLTYTFSNTSISATDYSWDFGDGNTATTKDATHTFPAVGTYTVTLSVSDKLGVSSTFLDTIEVVEPPTPAAIVPVIINSDFDKQPKSSGSDCSCAGWINKSLGSQGESSSGNGGSDNVVKFDNDEQDLIYQEFEISPNTDYSITFVAAWKDLVGNGFPSKLEVRILAESGYVDGYTPVYFATAAEYPQDDFGYRSVAQMEDTNNNLFTQVIDHPLDTSYLTFTYSFNSANNTSVALVMRGVGGDGTPSDDKGFLWNNGDEEIRVDYVIVEPIE
jgi:PKD repeat protein